MRNAYFSLCEALLFFTITYCCNKKGASRTDVLAFQKSTISCTLHLCRLLLWTKKCRCYCLRFWIMRSIKGEVTGCWGEPVVNPRRSSFIYPILEEMPGPAPGAAGRDGTNDTLRWPVTEDRQDGREKNPLDRLNLQDYELVKYYRKTVHESTIGLITYPRNCSWFISGLTLINSLREHRSSFISRVWDIINYA